MFHLMRRLEGGGGKRALVVVNLLLLYLVLSELFLLIFHAKQVRNDAEYYMSRTFTREEWHIAASIRDFFLAQNRSPRQLKGTIIYLHEPMRGEYYTINSDGFRGPEVTPKQPGEYRVVLTGASMAHGNTFADDATIPALVERHLRDRCPDCRITVYNLGLEGYDLQREIALAERLTPKVEPDLIVFYTGVIDLSMVYTAGYRRHTPYEKDGSFTEEEIDAVRKVYRKSWVDHFRITRLIADSVRNERGILPEPVRLTRDLDPFLPPLFDERGREFGRLYVKDMTHTAMRFAAVGIETMFVLTAGAVFKEPRSALESSALRQVDSLYPHFGAFSLASREYIRKEVAEANFDRFYDFSDAFDGIDADIFYDFIHMTPRGNRELSEKMGDLLIEKGVLEKARKALSTGSGQAATPNPSR